MYSSYGIRVHTKQVDSDDHVYFHVHSMRVAYAHPLAPYLNQSSNVHSESSLEFLWCLRLFRVLPLGWVGGLGVSLRSGLTTSRTKPKL